MCSQYFEIYCGSENVNLAKIFCFAQKDNTIVAIHVVHTCTSAKWIMDGMAVQQYGVCTKLGTVPHTVVTPIACKYKASTKILQLCQ